jgi:hypothetical protein
MLHEHALVCTTNTRVNRRFISQRDLRSELFCVFMEGLLAFLPPKPKLLSERTEEPPNRVKNTHAAIRSCPMAQRTANAQRFRSLGRTSVSISSFYVGIAQELGFLLQLQLLLVRVLLFARQLMFSVYCVKLLMQKCEIVSFFRALVLKTNTRTSAQTSPNYSNEEISASNDQTLTRSALSTLASSSAIFSA